MQASLRCRGAAVAPRARPAAVVPASRRSATSRGAFPRAESLRMRNMRLHASKKEEAEIEAMKKQMQEGDIWESEVFSNLFKVIIVAGIIGVSALLIKAGSPVLVNVVDSFPKGGAV